MLSWGWNRPHRHEWAGIQVTMDNNLADSIINFVKNGGVLVSESALASYDKLSNATLESLGFNLSDLFGGSEKNIIETNDSSVKINKDLIQGQNIFGGFELDTYLYLQTFNNISSDVIFSWDNKPAGLLNYYGKGKAYLIGTFFTLSANGKDFIKKLLCIESMYQTQTIITQILESDEIIIEIYFNPNNMEEKIDISDRSIIDIFAKSFSNSTITLTPNTSALIIYKK